MICYCTESFRSLCCFCNSSNHRSYLLPLISYVAYFLMTNPYYLYSFVVRPIARHGWDISLGQLTTATVKVSFIDLH